MTHMHGLVTLPGFPPASRCTLAGQHRPAPTRFIYHHVLPLGAGGKTEPGNVVQACDNCHMTVHELLWRLVAAGGDVSKLGRHKGTKGQLAAAYAGYQAAAALGTVGKIPNEG